MIEVCCIPRMDVRSVVNNGNPLPPQQLCVSPTGFSTPPKMVGT